MFIVWNLTLTHSLTSSNSLHLLSKTTIDTQVREAVMRFGEVKCKLASSHPADTKFKNYDGFSMSVASLMRREHAHKYLAIRRGKDVKELRVALDVPPQHVPAIIVSGVKRVCLFGCFVCCLFVLLFVCLFALFVCLFVLFCCLFVCLFVYLLVCLSN
jgi:hypothetical protein